MPQLIARTHRKRETPWIAPTGSLVNHGAACNSRLPTLAPQVGLEPATWRLTAAARTTAIERHPVGGSAGIGRSKSAAGSRRRAVSAIAARMSSAASGSGKGAARARSDSARVGHRALGEPRSVVQPMEPGSGPPRSARIARVAGSQVATNCDSSPGFNPLACESQRAGSFRVCRCVVWTSPMAVGHRDDPSADQESAGIATRAAHPTPERSRDRHGRSTSLPTIRFSSSTDRWQARFRGIAPSIQLIEAGHPAGC
jgi:hypothetical protein